MTPSEHFLNGFKSELEKGAEVIQHHPSPSESAKGAKRLLRNNPDARKFRDELRGKLKKRLKV